MTGNANVGVLPVTEDLFRIAADVAPGLVWMSGPDKQCTFFNKSLAGLHRAAHRARAGQRVD